MRNNYFCEKPESQMENIAYAQHYLGEAVPLLSGRK